MATVGFNGDAPAITRQAVSAERPRGIHAYVTRGSSSPDPRSVRVQYSSTLYRTSVI